MKKRLYDTYNNETVLPVRHVLDDPGNAYKSRWLGLWRLILAQADKPDVWHLIRGSDDWREEVLTRARLACEKARSRAGMPAWRLRIMATAMDGLCFRWAAADAEPATPDGRGKWKRPATPGEVECPATAPAAAGLRYDPATGELTEPEAKNA